MTGKFSDHANLLNDTADELVINVIYSVETLTKLINSREDVIEYLKSKHLSTIDVSIKKYYDILKNFDYYPQKGGSKTKSKSKKSKTHKRKH